MGNDAAMAQEDECCAASEVSPEISQTVAATGVCIGQIDNPRGFIDGLLSFGTGILES